ncbi:MAG: NAD(+) diphosphatase [Moraxella sp.]|nr:NAD(+) diphosphatase [Moraxella sp.]
MTQSFSAWVVDSDSSSLLCDKTGNPARLLLAKTALQTLQDNYATLYADKTLFGKSTESPQLVISLEALTRAGFLKKEGDTYRHNGQILIKSGYRTLLNTLNHEQLGLASHAIQLMRWQTENRYCGRCGTKTQPHPSEYAMVCSRCHHRGYPRVQPCVITAITRLCSNTKKTQILLALHHRHQDKHTPNNPKDAMHGLIAGFVEIGESLEQAVLRETLEETALNVTNLQYVGSQPWPYPSNLMAGFTAEYESGNINVQADELLYAKFFDLDDLPAIPDTGTIARTLIDHVITRHSLRS